MCLPLKARSARVCRNMDNPNFFPAAPRLKRKCEDSDVVLELLNDVSISPHKKLRQELGSTSYSDTFMDAGHFHSGYSNIDTSIDVELVEKLPNDLQLCPPEIDLLEQLPEPLPSPPVNDERAIVLYKPVNPPLFPGGPSAGSQLMLNANILSSGVLDSSNLLRGRNEGELSWLRVPSSGVRITELTEEEAKQHDTHLAVVPWVPNSSMDILVSQTTASPVFDKMCGENFDIEAMEEDNELSMDFVNSQPGNSNINFCYEPWQQYGAPQPQYSSIMWSC